jgi:hypothetical protein
MRGKLNISHNCSFHITGSFYKLHFETASLVDCLYTLVKETGLIIRKAEMSWAFPGLGVNTGSTHLTSVQQGCYYTHYIFCVNTRTTPPFSCSIINGKGVTKNNTLFLLINTGSAKFHE